MTDLRTAAQQALEFIRTMNQQGWMLADYEDDMERTVAGLEAALAEPVQEPDDPARRCGGPGCDGTCCQPVQEPQGCDHCNHPLYAAIKCRVCGRVTEPAPPQRKPLTEEEIKQLLFESAGMTVTFSAVDLSLARAIERAHNITGDNT